MNPTTAKARRLDAHLTYQRLHQIARLCGGVATLEGTPHTLVLTRPAGNGHLLTLDDPLHLMEAPTWKRICQQLGTSPGCRFHVQGHPRLLTPHDAVAALREHGTQVGHGYRRPHHRLTAHMIGTHGTRTPLVALPGPMPHPREYDGRTYARRQWSWVPPSQHPLITLNAVHNPHT